VLLAWQSFAKKEKKIVGARRGSPIVLGIGKMKILLLRMPWLYCHIQKK